MKYTIAVGNIQDGIRLHGIFITHEDALGYAELLFKREQWSIIFINTSINEN